MMRRHGEGDVQKCPWSPVVRILSSNNSAFASHQIEQVSNSNPFNLVGFSVSATKVSRAFLRFSSASKSRAHSFTLLINQLLTRAYRLRSQSDQA